MDTGYFLVDVGHLDSGEAGRFPPYLGIDRSPWRSVDEKYYAGELPSDLAALRKQSFRNHVVGLSFGTLASIHEVERLAKAGGESAAKGLQILVVEFLGSVTEAVTAFSDASCGIGFDAYADGFGSILNLGFVQRPDIFGTFLEKLNEYGLFTSVQDIQQYVAHYKCVAVAANLEIIEDSVPVLVYRIIGIHDLRSV